METNKEFLQVWDYILDNDELDLTDVIMLSKVISLHATKDGCYISNNGVSKLLRLKNIETASRRINKLEKMGYVELKYIPLPNNPKKTKRFIIPTYQNGLTQKSSRVDLKVNIPLTEESIPLDSKVNTPLTEESTIPCLESQSIISPYNINENISETHQLEHINELNNEISIDDKIERKSLLHKQLKEEYQSLNFDIIKFIDRDDFDAIERRDKELFDKLYPTILEYKNIKI